MRQFKVLLDNLAFGEGPRWHDEKLYFSDMHAHKVIAVDIAGRKRSSRSADVAVGAWMAAGRTDAGGVDDRPQADAPRSRRTQAARRLSKLASFIATTWWSMRAVAPTSATSASTHRERAAEAGRRLVMVEPDGAARVVARDLMFPNGTVITPDGKTLVVGESMGHRLTAFDIAADGALTNRRVWAELGEGVPDGICLDAENAIWVASPFTHGADAGEAGRRGGRADQGRADAIACMLGGPDAPHAVLAHVRVDRSRRMPREAQLANRNHGGRGCRRRIAVMGGRRRTRGAAA